MRLIDADALIEKADCLFEATNTKTVDFMRIGYNHAVSDCIAIAKNLPTADVVERKRGKWIDNKGLYQCSCCKHIWSELWWVESCPIDRMNKIMRFCPNCGADMRKETEDDRNS